MEMDMKAVGRALHVSNKRHLLICDICGQFRKLAIYAPIPSSIRASSLMRRSSSKSSTSFVRCQSPPANQSRLTTAEAIIEIGYAHHSPLSASDVWRERIYANGN